MVCGRGREEFEFPMSLCVEMWDLGLQAAKQRDSCFIDAAAGAEGVKSKPDQKEN